MSISKRLNPVRIIGGAARSVEHGVEGVIRWDARIEHRRNVQMHAQLQKAAGRKGPTVDKFGLAVSPISLKPTASSSKPRKRKP